MFLKNFSLEKSFEIFFKKQFLIPYSVIDDVEIIYPEYGGEAIYMILQTERLEFTKIHLNSDLPIIEYRNISTGKTHQIDNIWFFPIPVPRNALQMELASKTLIEVGIKEEWRKCYPEFE
jgi:hypothetical protein